MNRIRVSVIVFLTLALLLAAGAPGLKAQTAEAGWTSAWIDGSGDLSDDAVKHVVDQLAARDPNPEHIVFLIHGFDTPRACSTDQYDDLTPRLRAAFQKLGKKVSVVGVQWDSAAQGGLLALLGQYEAKVPLARKTGRQGVRRLMLAIQERFPKAHVSLLAHSMGCEVTAAASAPEVNFDQANDQAGAWRPEKDLAFDVVVLAGSDLNYDAAYRSGVKMSFKGCELLWMTVSRLYRRDRDKVLDLRALIRGKAMGSTLPRMTGEQYRALLGARKGVFDSDRIPPTHDFLMYYDDVRLARVVGAMAWKADPKGVPEPEDLAEIDRVMEAPATTEALLPFLDSRKLATAIYAVWRLENVLGDGEKHLEDEYLSHLADGAVNRPRAVRSDRQDSPCAVVKAGYWPTAGQLARAGAPPWADPLGSSWKKDFRGEVVALDDHVMEILTDYGDYQVFDLSDSKTQCTPGRAAIRVGSAVQVRSDFDHTALQIKVIPFPEWLKTKVAR